MTTNPNGGEAAQISTGDALSGGPAAPVVVDTSERDPFQDQLDAFLGYQFDDPADDEDEADPPAAGVLDGGGQPEERSRPLPAGQQPPAAQPSPAQTPAGNASPQAPNAPAADPAGAVDPALLAMVLGAAEVPKPAVPAAAQPTPQPQPSATPAAEETWNLFPERMELPAPLISALFESEDSATRAQALSGLLSSYGNFIAQQVEQRFQTQYAPKIHQQFVSRQAEAEQARAVHTEFYGAFPDLAKFPQVVTKAFQAIQAADPNATWSPEVRDKVGNLALTALQRMGVIQAKAPTPQPVAPTPKPGGKKTPYLAGGARPAGVGGDPAASAIENAFAGLGDF